MSFKSTFKVITSFSITNVVSYNLFQTEAAECLKPRNVNAVDTELLEIKYFDDFRRVRTGL